MNGVDSIKAPNHQPKLFGIAVLDVLATIAGGYFISYYFGYPLLYSIVGLFIFGEFVHLFLNIDTPVIQDVQSLFAKL